MNAEELRARCEQLVAAGKARGADDVEVWGEHAKRVAASIEHNDIKGAEAEEHVAFGMRVFKAGAMGFAYVNRIDDASLTEALDDALAIARATPADEDNGLAEPAAAVSVDGLFDERLTELGVEEAVEKARELVQASRAVDERVSIDSGSFAVSYGDEAIANSRGVSASNREAAIVYSLFGMAVDGDEVGSFDYDYRGHRDFDEVDTSALGGRFGKKVLALLRPQDAKAYRGKVIFTPEAFEEVFVSPILSAVDGDNVLKGKSRWTEKLGERVAGAGFNLVEDGTRAGRLYSSPFDREGVPRARTPIVEDGVLKTFLYDVRAARRAKAKPTGHAQGGARSLPSIGTTNVSFDGGSSSESALLDGLGDGLLVGRFSGNVDPISGDFSGVAKGAFWVENGEKKYPVKETLVAGNTFALLEKIIARGDKVHDTVGFEGPWVLVDGVDVTSGA